MGGERRGRNWDTRLEAKSLLNSHTSNNNRSLTERGNFKSGDGVFPQADRFQTIDHARLFGHVT